MRAMTRLLFTKEIKKKNQKRIKKNFMVEVIFEQDLAFQMEQKEHSRQKEWLEQRTVE